MPTRNRTAARSTVRRAYLSAELAATSPMGPSVRRWDAPAGGAATPRQHDHNPARSAGQGPRLFSGGRYRESPARCSPPRRAWSPRGGVAEADPYARRHRMIRPRTMGGAILENGPLARSCARALMKNVGGEAGAPAASRADRIRPIAVHVGDGVECVCERKLEARRDPLQAKRVCSSAPGPKVCSSRSRTASTLISTAASACGSI